MNIVEALKKVKNELVDFVVTNLNNKSDTTHTHDQYADVDHNHNYNDLNGAPTSFPASGGDADTVDGMHANEFALADTLDELSEKVGKDSVIDQIQGYAAPIEHSHDDYVVAVTNSRLITLDEAAKLGAIEFVDEKAVVPYNNVDGLSDMMDGKVNKVDGKGLSTNDYTDDEKAKLDGIDSGANKTVVDGTLSETSTNPVQNKIVTGAIDKINEYIGGKAVSAQIAEYAAPIEHSHGDYMAISNPTGTGALSMNRKSETTVGINSVALGGSTTASGNYSHAEGFHTIASGRYSHAEGNGDPLTTFSYTGASGDVSHAEGHGCSASGSYSHAEGYCSIASGEASHAEGYSNDATAQGSHAEGQGCSASGNHSHAEGFHTIASGMHSHAEGMEAVASEYASHAEGYKTEASEQMAHAEGYSTVASGKSSHAEGADSKASNQSSHAEGTSTESSGHSSHAEGSETTASGTASHAEGGNTIASGHCSHAEGGDTTASGSYSHACGAGTVALDYQIASGYYNDSNVATAGTGGLGGTAFVIGNGGANYASNACRITFNGQVVGKAAYSATGADYAEYFEWSDGNESNEDRVGYFVTFDDGRFIRKANDGDYILGIVSGNPCVLGNHDECWMGQNEMDEWGRFIYVTETGTDKVTGETYEYQTYKVNPNYDREMKYIPRSERPEWSAIGMIGVLAVRDDGTCKVNGYCKVTDGGIATAAETGYRVIERVSDNIIKIVFK